MNQNDSVTEYKADKGLRFINYIIDIFTVMLLLFILFFIIGIIIYTINFTSINYDDIDDFPLEILSMVFYALIYAGLEILTKGRSIGKYITGTKVVMIDGTNPTTKVYFIRNFCRLIPFDAVSFLFSNGWHDKFSNTTVVRKKAFEESLLTNNSINEIGN